MKRLTAKAFIKIILITSVMLCGLAQAAIPTAQRNTLIGLYTTTGGSSWTNNTGWLDPAGTECNWYGVTCNGAKTTVTGIDLSNNNLVGSIPATTGAFNPFQDLENLNLSQNTLSGSIPANVGELTNLLVLNLGGNQFDGSIPTSIAKLSKLTTLYLYSNNLSGSIPADIGSLSALQYLSFEHNDLTGQIPASLGGLSNLLSLNLRYNWVLEGAIPDSLGNLTKLTYLGLGGNNLSGTIPASLGKLVELWMLDLGGNDLSGAIPATLRNLTKVRNFYLESNRLESSIPAFIGGFQQLDWLDLSFNQLSGPIPEQLGNLPKLVSLRLSDNQLSGTIPESLAKPSATLIQLYLDRNKLSGAIPVVLGDLTNLTHLGLSANNLLGKIPASLINLTSLNSSGLNLNYNGLYTNDTALLSHLNSYHSGGDFTLTQTMDATDVVALSVGSTDATIDWSPVAYTVNDGGYRIYISQNPIGGFTFIGEIPGKLNTGVVVANRESCTTYYVKVYSYTSKHPQNLKNEVESDGLTGNVLQFTTLGNCPPVITGGTGTFKIAEDTAPGTAVTTITASDANDDDLTYSIVSGNGGGKFVLHSATGVLGIAAPLDYETNNSYVLAVNVDDGNGATTSGTITVNITDVDETPPPEDTPPTDDDPLPTDGGGGCSVRSGAPFDPLWPLLVLIAGLYLRQRYH